MMNCETFIDGDSLGNTITRIADNTIGSSGRVEGENGLIGNVQLGDLECLEHDIGHLLSVDFGVECGLSQKNWILPWVGSQNLSESMVPHPFHILPISYETSLDWVGDLEYSSLFLGLITKELVLLFRTHHKSGILGSSYYCGENTSWGLFS